MASEGVYSVKKRNTEFSRHHDFAVYSSSCGQPASQPVIHPFIHAFMHSCIHSFISVMRSFIHSFIHSSIHSFIHACMHAFIHACMHNCDYRRNEPSACSMPEPEKPQCQQSRTPSPLPCSVTPVIHSSALEPVHTRLVKSAPLGDVNRTCNPSSHS